MPLNKKENKELIIRDIEEKFSELFVLKFDKAEFVEKFIIKVEEVFEESFNTIKELEPGKDYSEEELIRLDEEESRLHEEFVNFINLYQGITEYAEAAVKSYNKFCNKTKSYTYEPFVSCIYLEDEGIYKYTINEFGIMQKSFELYIKQIYEHYNLMKKYLETH
mgnify:CR=1 FL=1